MCRFGTTILLYETYFNPSKPEFFTVTCYPKIKIQKRDRDPFSAVLWVKKRENRGEQMCCAQQTDYTNRQSINQSIDPSMTAIKLARALAKRKVPHPPKMPKKVHYPPKMPKKRWVQTQKVRQSHDRPPRPFMGPHRHHIQYVRVIGQLYLLTNERDESIAKKKA